MRPLVLSKAIELSLVTLGQVRTCSIAVCLSLPSHSWFPSYRASLSLSLFFVSDLYTITILVIENILFSFFETRFSQLGSVRREGRTDPSILMCYHPCCVNTIRNDKTIRPLTTLYYIIKKGTCFGCTKQPSSSSSFQKYKKNI